MGIKHLPDTMFGLSEVQNEIQRLRGTLGSRFGDKTIPSPDIPLSHGRGDSVLRWILNDVSVSGEVVDLQGTIRWTVKDTIDSKTFEEILGSGIKLS
jgi:hypothetical protein